MTLLRIRHLMSNPTPTRRIDDAILKFYVFWHTIKKQSHTKTISRIFVLTLTQCARQILDLTRQPRSRHIRFNRTRHWAASKPINPHNKPLWKLLWKNIRAFSKKFYSVKNSSNITKGKSICSFSNHLSVTITQPEFWIHHYLIQRLNYQYFFAEVCTGFYKPASQLTIIRNQEEAIKTIIEDRTNRSNCSIHK